MFPNVLRTHFSFRKTSPPLVFYMTHFHILSSFFCRVKIFKDALKCGNQNWSYYFKYSDRWKRMEFTLRFRSEIFKLFLTALGIPWRYLRDTLEYISYWCSAYVCVRRKGLLFRTNLKNTGLDTAFNITCDWIHCFGQPHHTWYWLVNLRFSFCLYLYRFFFFKLLLLFGPM